MKAIHFGAGNIGRGFIGYHLYKSGYNVVFADVQADLIDALNDQKEYTVFFAEEGVKPETVKGIRAINSLRDEEPLLNEIVNADIITTAVGPNILPIVSKTIAKGLNSRNKQNNKAPVLIMACENMIDATDFLKESIQKEISNNNYDVSYLNISYANTAVDRIIPIQQLDNIVDVEVETFSEWVIDTHTLTLDHPEIYQAHFVDDLTPYIERKLFTVNTGHAMAAYLGYIKHYNSIYEAIHDDKIQYAVRAALNETGALLEKKFGFDHKEHQEYIETTINRFKNKRLSDQVKRVARSPLRKLGPYDRLVKPAKQYVEAFNETPKALAEAIASVFLFENPEDDESMKLHQMIRETGVENAIEVFTGIQNFSILFDTVKKSYSQLQ